MSESDVLTPSNKSNAPGPRWWPSRVRLAGYLVGVALAVGLAAAGFWLVTVWKANSPKAVASDATAESTPAATAQPSTWQRPAVSAAGLADRSGVRIVYVAVTGGGGLIDLRFQVVDPDKADSIHNNATPPALVDDATGVVVNNLLMGHSHTNGFTAGQTYYLIFENPGNLVQQGGTVSVLLGNAQVDHVTVQ